MKFVIDGIGCVLIVIPANGNFIIKDIDCSVCLLAALLNDALTDWWNFQDR